MAAGERNVFTALGVEIITSISGHTLLFGLFYPAGFVVLRIHETAKNFSDPDRSDPYGTMAMQRHARKLAADLKKLTRGMDGERRRQFAMSVELKNCIERNKEDAVNETVRLGVSAV